MHTKHSKLSKPSTGLYARNEFTILGTPCGVIEKLVQDLKAQMGNSLTIGYMDADHKAPEKEQMAALDTQYTDKIKFHAFTKVESPSSTHFRSFFHTTNLLFVNGNHFDGDQQLVVIDPAKYESLKKRKNRLTNVVGFLLKDVEKLPDFVYELVKDAGKVPVLGIADLHGIASLINKHIQTPKVKALILAGGKSVRMGKDKTQITYHDKPQVQHLYELLERSGLDVYISHRQDQESPGGMRGLADTFLNLGPFGGILSALQYDPDSAWLTVAIDMPFITQNSIDHILKNRDSNKLVTSYLNPENELPEPLFSIWEPQSYIHLLAMLSQGVTCPRKSIIKAESKVLLHPEDLRVIKNINTPEDLEEARKLLENQG